MKKLMLLVFCFTIFTGSCFSFTLNITLGSFNFSPSNSNISVGDTVKWTWTVGNHTTTCDGSSFTGRPAGAPAWNAPLNFMSPTYTYVVTVPGTYNYKCTFHAPTMVGSFTANSSNAFLNLVCLVEGMFDGSVMVPDTVKAILRMPASPYPAVDNKKVKLNAQGGGIFEFENAPSGSYYIVVTHRNAIETWSSNPQNFSTGSMIIYDFSSSAGQAFGSNQIQKGSRFAFYSGDANQDGVVELSDIIIVFNDAGQFVTGYFPSDMNGDNVTDLTDIVITFNNSNNFISVIRP